MDPLFSQVTAPKPADGTKEDRLRRDTQASRAVLPLAGDAGLLAFLGDVNSHAMTKTVERIDSADCILFLTDHHCYKLRREMPLEQSFSLSLEQRHERAFEEIKLGKSFAPDLYIGLVPVRLNEDGFYVDHAAIEDGTRRSVRIAGIETAPVVEWLIKMRRYDVSKSLSKSVEIYRPNFTECHKLAELVAKTPDAAEQIDGQRAAVWQRHLSQMLASFSPAVRQMEQKTKQQTLRACLNRALYRVGALSDHLVDRSKRGLFGEIHGNVGLENVLQTSKGLQLVNPAVGQLGQESQAWFGDPVYDLASLVAELWARGLNRQANWVFSHYCNNLLDSHEVDGLQAMDLYLFVSAFEKARQLSLQKPVFDNGASQEQRLFHGYVKTARDSLVQDEAKLIVLGGSLQANRSHLARLLAPVIGRMPGAAYMSAYQEMLSLYDVRHESELPQSAHRRSVWHLVYRRLATKAQLALQAGYSVILSGAFDSPSSRRNLTILQQKIGPSVSLQAFHLFDPVGEQRTCADGTNAHHGQRLPSWMREMEHLSRPDNHAVTDPVLGSVCFDAPLPRDNGLVLDSDDDSLDWTSWTELDASRSVGSLVDQVLGHVNPVWVPIAEGTLH